MQSVPQISDAEYEVMIIIWEKAPISTIEVTNELIPRSNWSPKTIQTLLLRLVKKGALTYEKEGRVFVYTPLIAQKDYLAYENKSFLKRFYDGTLQAMVLNFIENDKLSKEELAHLQQILEKGIQEEEK